MEVAPPGLEPAPQPPPARKSEASYHWAMRPLRRAHWSSFSLLLVKVQVTVLSVLNLPLQGIPATCPIGH